MAIRIKTTRDGSVDINSIEKLTVDQLSAWILARLKGRDEYFPLDKTHGEDPSRIFVWAVDTSTNDGFVARLHKAIARVINEETAAWAKSKTASREKTLFELFILAEAANPEDNRTRSTVSRELPETLMRLALSETFSDKKESEINLKLRLLFALRKCQTEIQFRESRDFWLEIAKNDIYAAPAFSAFARWEAEPAVALVPHLITAHLRKPGLVTEYAAQIEIEALYEKFAANPNGVQKWKNLTAQAFKRVEYTPAHRKFKEWMREITEDTSQPPKATLKNQVISFLSENLSRLFGDDEECKIIAQKSSTRRSTVPGAVPYSPGCNTAAPIH